MDLSLFSVLVNGLLGLTIAYVAWLTRQINAKATSAAAAVVEVKTVLAETTVLKIAAVEEVKVTLLASAAETAAKVAEVKKDLDSISETTTQKLDVIHILVNSEMHIALEAVATLSRRIADMPGSSVQDQEAAVRAEYALTEHDARQIIVDARTATREVASDRQRDL